MSVTVDTARINVIYPKPDQTIARVDSTFIFGHVVLPEGMQVQRLIINGQPVAVHIEGGFLAFLPVRPGRFMFRLEADVASRIIELSPRQWRLKARQRSNTKQRAPVHLTDSLVINVAMPLPVLPKDSLMIGQEFPPPPGDLVLHTGDRLQVRFRGTPGCRAWFALPGVIDSVSMTEMGLPTAESGKQSVFGAGALPASRLLSGMYAGFYDVPADISTDTVRIQYYLVAPVREIVRNFLLPPYHPADVEAVKLLGADTIQTAGSYTVTMNSSSFPFTVEFTDSVQIVRHGPGLGYLSIFQPAGVQALVVGAEGDWYKIRLSATQTGWVKKSSVQPLSQGILPPRSLLASIRTYDTENHVLITFPLSGKHPFRIIECDRRTIRVQLFGVTSNTDWIRYDCDDELIDLVVWSQPEKDLYQLDIHLNGDLWGYDAYYRGNRFCLQLNKPPRQTGKLRDKIIVIDPGHSGDPGAVGPTGYTEAEANLAIALALRKELKSKGAHVVMTREDDRHVELYDRPMIAMLNDADLFISIHNNALPDGANPFVNNGTSVYYYHPHAINLARAIHTELVKATRLADHGLYHGNLAVVRPTQYPAVLLECAFMMIPEQEAMLKTSKFRKRLAKAITRGISNFLKEFNHDH
ncbi:MAG: N-acetylmuramoyl-L-alanine amidase [bacterium]